MEPQNSSLSPQTQSTTAVEMAPNQPVPVQLQRFDIFLDLPFELRTMVWKAALLAEGAKLVTIRSVKHSLDDHLPWVWVSWAPLDDCGLGGPKIPIEARYPVSHLLGTNKESRAVVKKEREAAFASHLGGSPVYFDFRCDGLFFADMWAFASFFGKGTEAWAYVTNDADNTSVGLTKDLAAIAFDAKEFDSRSLWRRIIWSGTYMKTIGSPRHLVFLTDDSVLFGLSPHDVMTTIVAQDIDQEAQNEKEAGTYPEPPKVALMSRKRLEAKLLKL